MTSSAPLPDLHVTAPDDTMEITTPGGNADDMIDIDVDISGISPGKDQEGDYLLDDASDYGQQPDPVDSAHHQDQVMEDEDDFLVDDDDGDMVDDTNEEDVHFRDASYDEDVHDAPDPDPNANPGEEIDLQDEEVDVLHFDDPTQDNPASGDLNSSAPTASHPTEQASSMEQEDSTKLGQVEDSIAHSYEAHDSNVPTQNNVPQEGLAEAFQVEDETWQEHSNDITDVEQNQPDRDWESAPQDDGLIASATEKSDRPVVDGDEEQNQNLDTAGGQQATSSTHSNSQTAVEGDEPANPQTNDNLSGSQDHLNVGAQEDDNESEFQFEDEDHDDTQNAPTDPTNPANPTQESNLHHTLSDSKAPEADEDTANTVQAKDAVPTDHAELQDGAHDGDDGTYNDNEVSAPSDDHAPQQASYADAPSHRVMVDWAGEHYSLFPSENGDAQAFFVQDESLVNDSIQKLLGACRVALGESVEAGEVVEFEIVELGLYISEDCADAPSTTLSEILDIYVQLHQYKDGSDGDALVLQLTTRPRFASRLSALLQAAQDGKHISELTFLKQDSQYTDEFAPDYDQNGEGPDPSLQTTFDTQDGAPSPELADLSEKPTLEHPADHPEGLRDDGLKDQVTEGADLQQHAEGTEEDENYFDIFGEDEDAKDIASGGAVQYADEHPIEHQAPSAEAAAEAAADAASAADDDVLEFDDDLDEPSPSTLRDEHTPQVTQNGHDEPSHSKDTSMHTSDPQDEGWADDDLAWLEDAEPSKPAAPTSDQPSGAAATENDEEDFITYDDEDESAEDQASLKRPRDPVDDVPAEETDSKRRRSE